jgi:CheY-like chemotaxis protein
VAFPLLLVHDDLATIALVRRTLVRAGHTVELATSTADALTAAATLQPALVLLAPGVESGRGAALLLELHARPETARLRILLLGRMVDGHRGSVLPTPFRAETLLQAVDQALAADPPTDEPVTDMFGSGSASIPIAVGPETMDLDWEPPTGPMLSSGYEPVLEAVLDPAQLAPVAVPLPAPDYPVETFDAGSLLEAEPEPEPVPLGEDEVLFAPEEPPALVSDLQSELEHTSPMLAVAAGAWSATTDDRLAPAGKVDSSASALLEDIASEARARENQARAAEQALEEARRLRAEAEALAESRTRDAREASAAALTARIDADEARTQADTARADAAAARAEADAARADAVAARAEAESARVHAEVSRTAHEAAESARAELQRALQQERERASAARAAVESAQATGVAEAELLATTLREAEARAESETNARLALEARSQADIDRLGRELHARAVELEQLRGALSEASAANVALSEASQSLEREATELAARLAAEERAAVEARRRAEAWVHTERAQGDELRRELLELRTEVRRLREELEQGRGRMAEAEIRVAQQSTARVEAEEAARAAADEAARLRQKLQDARAETEQIRESAERRARADEERRQAEVRAQAEAEAAEAARRETERARWAVADAGRVTLEDLAALLFRLEGGRATARLELRSADALRVLWLEEGELAAAASTVSTESVLDHAIRDGLVDAAADRELRILRLGEPELIQELLRRKLITDAEMVPFLQRLTEARALEAFSEPVSFYRLSADTPPPEGRRAAVRPLSALAAEGVRRGLPAEEVDRLVPSMRGVPKMVRRVDPQALGLGDRERRLLEGIDGQRTVQQLLLATGVSRDPGRKALAVAVALGWLELQPPSQEEARAETVEVAAARLEARWAQVEDADYFTVLGLPRNAGTDEVARAFARLSAEYDPLRWSGHPDPRVQARAERMQALLSEAARALSDDVLRSAYARSLGE